MNEGSIKVGMIMDLTGPLSFLGLANANVAKMVVDEINPMHTQGDSVMMINENIQQITDGLPSVKMPLNS